MNDFLPFIVAGLVGGAVYGLAGTGLALTYKTSGVFNFGYGALATAAAYVFYILHVSHHMPWGWAALISVVVLGAVLGFLLEPLMGLLNRQRTYWKVAGTVGLVLIAQGAGSIAEGEQQKVVPKFLPGDTKHFRLFGTNVFYDQLTIFVVAVVAVVALYLLFNHSRLGIAMRAVVNDPDLLGLQGTAPRRVRRIAWLLGSMFACLSGVLILPSIGLQSTALTFLVIEAFGAAAVGYFSSIPLVLLGGMLIGVLASLSTKYVNNHAWLSGLPASLPFLVLIVVLLLASPRRLGSASAIEKRPRLEWHGPPVLRLSVGVVVLVFLVLVPSIGNPVVGNKLPFFTVALTQMILFVALGLLVRTAGMVSLCTAAFAAVGAVSMSQFAVDHGLPWGIALLFAGLVAVPVGALVALPTVRLNGVFLALVTLGFGLMVQDMFYSNGFMFTSLATGRFVPRPSFAQDDKSYYYVVLGIFVVIAAGVVWLQSSRLGRMLRGLSESPVATSSFGLNPIVSRLLVFCIAAFISAVGGALYGGFANYATSADPYYQAFTSLVLLTILAISPFRDPWYLIVGGAASIIPAYLPGLHTQDWLNILFGVSVMVVAAMGGPQQMPVRGQQWFDAKFRRHRPTVAPGTVGASGTDGMSGAGREELDTARPSGEAAEGLVVAGLSVRFGGLVAVRDFSLKAPMASITGLIGPNGAGKTTTFNACSGLVRAEPGSTVHLHGRDLTHAAPSKRAGAGLARTFQLVQLCESLTVYENVALGREAVQAGRRAYSQVFGTRRQKALRRAATAHALELCGITDLATVQAGALSTGHRRLVELARCLAGPFDFLMLDEPSSGLDAEETARFAEVLRRVVRERGTGILLVEHDVPLVLDLCEYIYVLDFGEGLFDGTPDEVVNSVAVQRAYLGKVDEHEPPLGVDASVSSAVLP